MKFWFENLRQARKARDLKISLGAIVLLKIQNIN